MRLGCLVATLVWLALPARAELLQAKRDSVMCSSAAALAKLALPGGGSRYARTGSDKVAEQIAREGGCDAVPKGQIVIVDTARVRTSIVRMDSLTGDGVLTKVLVPNIDFAPYTPAPDAFWTVVRSRCPSLLDVLAAGGAGTQAFIASLPPPVRSSIDREVDARCGGALPCMLAERETALRGRHLDARWAAFDCDHPAESTERMDRNTTPIRN